MLRCSRFCCRCRRFRRAWIVICTSQILLVGCLTGGRSGSEVEDLLHSCGTAPDSHRTFPVASSGWSPLEPMVIGTVAGARLMQRNTGDL